MKIKITGIGSYIPEKKVSNIDFNNHVFLNEDGTTFGYPNDVVIKNLKA
jgi:3-oxoacyl-[acyl-carrier-protein] synthase-3